MTPEVSLCGNMMMNRYNLFSTLLEQVSLDWRSLNFLKAGFPWLFYCMATVRMSLATTTTSNVVPKLFFLNPEPYCIITSSKYEGYRDLILVDINKYYKPTKQKYTTNFEETLKDREKNLLFGNVIIECW